MKILKQMTMLLNGSASAWLDDQWGGSCYGMSSLALISKNKLFPYSDYRAGAVTLNQLSMPRNDRNVNSLITYYQMLQVKQVIQQQYSSVPSRPHEMNIKAILEELDKYGVIMIGFQKNGWGGHSVLSYGYEYGSWTWNGVTYDGCILICAPNNSISYDNTRHIYFNSKTYSWAIPAYSGANLSSAYGAVFNYIGGNVEEINQGGYLSGAGANPNNQYVARLDAAAIAENHSVSKVSRNDGGYFKQNSAAGDIVADMIYMLSGSSEGTFGYNLFDSASAYEVTQNTPQSMNLAIKYQNCMLSGSSAAGKDIIFDQNGLVSVAGEQSDFAISMTYNDNYPTDWFSVSVRGSSSEQATMEMTADGYILTAQQLHNVSVHTNNKDAKAAVTFSTDYNSVLLYEIDEYTIGVAVDTDGNGSYETTVAQSDHDIDTNGSLNIADAVMLARVVSEDDHIDTAAVNWDAADINLDGLLTILDVTALLTILAK